MKNFVYEDFIIEESMGPISDRSKEYLGTSDLVIIRFRKMLLDALKRHEKGELPFGVGDDLDFSHIRALAIRYPGHLDWKTIDTIDPPDFQFADIKAAE